MTMDRHAKGAWVFLMAGILCSFAAKASATESSPYEEIVDRNLFGLRAPVPSIVENPATTPAIPKITLTGITTILGRKVAFITIARVKTGQPPEFLMLAQGQSSDGLQVEEIDEKAGFVKIANHGQLQTLDFEHDSTKPSGSPPNAKIMFSGPTIPGRKVAFITPEIPAVRQAGHRQLGN